MKREEYNYWLANINNIGVKKIEWLLSVFGCAEEIYRADKKELMTALAVSYEGNGTKLREEEVESLIRSRDRVAIQEAYGKLIRSGIRFITREEADYPEKLKNIYSAPFALYRKGRPLEEGKKYLAVVGARDCSPYGREMSRYLAGAIAKEGVVIISGLARGIDSYAHQGALEAGGISYGILGCGIDICYPRENIKLYMELMKEGGVISEYAPGTPPIAGNFPLRNRIISGLSDGILVIEAREKSGSLITVDLGLDQGKDIYAVPGKASDRLSEGCNNLIKMGAKLVTTPKDILEELFPNYEQNLNEMKININVLESHEKIVYASLDFEPKHMEELHALTKLPMDILMEQLLLLELKGLVHQTMKNYYVLRK